MSVESITKQITPIDSLTGLPNRQPLVDELASTAAEDPGNFALVFVDLDGLKLTNDTYGHQYGDQLIIDASNILASGLRTDQEETSEREARPGDEVAYRLGGDEFVVMLKNVSEQNDVDKVIARLQKDLADGGIKASMAGRPHKPGESGADFLHDVDQKMYDFKKARKSYEAQYARHKERQDYRRELEALPMSKFLVHTGGVAIRRASEKLSGVKGIKD